MRGSARIFLFAVAAFISLLLDGGRATAQTVGAETGIEGTTAGVPGGQLHLVVTITKGSGELAGTMNSVDQHAVLTLSNVTLKSHAVRFEAPRVGGVGLLLPTTPVHHLLLAALGLPVVATSGNRSEEPIVIGEREALRRHRCTQNRRPSAGDVPASVLKLALLDFGYNLLQVLTDARIGSC